MIPLAFPRAWFDDRKRGKVPLGTPKAGFGCWIYPDPGRILALAAAGLMPGLLQLLFLLFHTGIRPLSSVPIPPSLCQVRSTSAASWPLSWCC